MTKKPHSLDDAKLDFDNSMSYGDYLALDDLLTTQHPLSQDPDELLFIVQHQTNELWMKLILHELRQARNHIQQDNLSPTFKMLARVSRIMEQLISAWSVLSTLTPSEYSRFRPYLGHSSGFQSHQYRLIEFILGNKNEVLARPFRHKEALYAEVQHELHIASIYDEAVKLLAKRGFAIDNSVLERDWSQAYAWHESVQQAWLAIYRDPDNHWDLYELAEELVDLADSFKQWQFRHFSTVRRIIGFKRGTGGTAGVGYLRDVVENELFPELWRVRTDL
jgi:tryptophan 2,3-dioxygenase